MEEHISEDTKYRRNTDYIIDNSNDPSSGLQNVIQDDLKDGEEIERNFHKMMGSSENTLRSQSKTGMQ